MELLEKEKNSLVEKALGVKDGGFIHDTLLEHVKVDRSAGKETILKPEEQVIKHSYVPPEQSELKNSRLTDPKRSQIQPSHSVLVSNPSHSNVNNTVREP